MARNWGGDGVEHSLDTDEYLLMRFGNYYLTNRRLGHYNTLKSVFEFIPLGYFDMTEGHGTLIEGVLISAIIIFSAVTIAGLFTIHTDPAFTIVGIVGTFQIFYAYNLIRRWSKDSYIIRFRGKSGKWILRTFNSEKGLSFALEVAKANNASGNVELNYQG